MSAALSCEPNPTSPRLGLSDLPFELFELILRPLCPTLPRGPYLPLPWRQNVRSILRELKPFADLRCVSVAFNLTITPIFFQETIILISPFSQPEKIADFFRSGAPYMKSVVIFGHTEGRRPGTQWPTPALKEALGQGLGLLTRLENLECHGEHAAFADSLWFQTFTPNLASTVSSLCITPVYQFQEGVYESILSLGASLTHLTIVDWVGGCAKDEVNFPTTLTLPKLTHLTLQHGNPPPRGLRKLFASLMDEHGRTSLRSLCIMDLRTNYDVEIITNLLITDCLGEQLDTLRLRLSLTKSTKAAEFPKVVLQACPNLKEFSYATRPVDRGIFSYLPPTLERLEVTALPASHVHARTSVTPEAIAAFLRSQNRQALQAVSVRSLSSNPGMAVDPLLTAVCEEVGAKMSDGGNGSAMIVLKLHKTFGIRNIGAIKQREVVYVGLARNAGTSVNKTRHKENRN
ncbi:hypothetical protein H0H92_010094 [Tricholoma furcatifolium]|nr:hypothetical protein H0H92_010094 [Tricholoma furcatifolium]